MTIFILVAVIIFISSVLYRVLAEKKEMEFKLNADLERCRRNYESDIELEKERYHNLEKISESDLNLIEGLCRSKRELEEAVKTERREKLVQCEYIRDIEKRLDFTSNRLEKVLDNSFNFEKSVAECGLFEPEIKEKLKVLVRTKNKRISNKNQKAAIKFLLKCQ